MAEYLFTSESVSEGHPDKIADQVSDAILDAVIEKTQRESSGKSLGERLWTTRVACETLVKTGMTVLAGEMRTDVHVDFEKIVRGVIKDIGYREHMGFDYENSAVLVAVGSQSSEIAIGVDSKKGRKDLGAGDQGMMFGYACSETPELMPAPIQFAHRMVRRQADLRKKGGRGGLPWLRPDAKSQVTFKYREGRPVSVEGVVFSTQHDPEIDGSKVVKHDKRLKEAVVEAIIRPSLSPQFGLPKRSNIHINPTGLFIEGGPKADCGLTGRKIIVDTYGGHAPHGGGAFSGKDPSKVDRTGAYITRYIAKNIVAAKMAEKCLVQIAYAIGVTHPVSLTVETYGTARKPWDNERIANRVKLLNFLSPGAIIERLNLWEPIYRQFAAYGHFGRKESDATWEKTDLKDELLG